MTTTDLDFAKHLGELLGVPLLVSAPNPDYPGEGADEFLYPTGARDSFSASGNDKRMSSWQPGKAILGVMGGPVAVVDVDPRNGGDIERTRQLLDGLGTRTFAEVQTPSGGRHFYIAANSDLPHCSKLDGWPGIDIQAAYAALVFVPGTRRPKYGGAGYTIISDDLEALADGGDPDGAEAFAYWVADRRGKGANFDPSPAWDGDIPDQRQAAYLAAALKGMRDDLAAMGKDSGRNTAAYNSGLTCGNYIAGAGMDEAEAVAHLLEGSTRNGLVRDDGQRSVMASIMSGIRNGRARPRAVPAAKLATLASGSTARPGPAMSPDARLAALAALLTDLRTWQHLPDPVHVIAALAAAATRNSEGEPCWLLMVAPPSSGKTETVRLLDAAADARLDEVTAAGLLGWSKGKVIKPSGVLTRIGDRALATFGDLSSLLATSDRGGRDQVFGLLRRAYDGHVTRDVSPPGKVDDYTRLEWSGRLTVVACVTGAIDRYTAHTDQLGPRWVYVRIPDRDTHGKRSATRLARRDDLTAHRTQARQAVAALLSGVPGALPELPDDVADAIEDAALVTAWGRGSVPRNGYGRREIEGIPVVEEPMRVVQQLDAIARGVLALGLPDEAAAGIARRVALDSMPGTRRAVLEALATGEVMSTAGCARAAQLDRKVARMTLEELAEIGVVEHDREDDETDDHIGVVHWQLRGNDGAVIGDVFDAHRQAARGWDETWVYTSTSPQEREERDVFTGVHPTLRPTPQDVATRTARPHRPDCRVCGADLPHSLRPRGTCGPCHLSMELRSA